MATLGLSVLGSTSEHLTWSYGVLALSYLAASSLRSQGMHKFCTAAFPYRSLRICTRLYRELVAKQLHVTESVRSIRYSVEVILRTPLNCNLRSITNVQIQGMYMDRMDSRVSKCCVIRYRIRFQTDVSVPFNVRSRMTPR